jgi:hypothetical protein
MGRQLLAIAVVAVFVGSPVIYAHHSYANFDQDRTVSIDGTIEKITFANPHTILTVRMKDATAYTITWAARRQLSSQGVAASDLKIGEVVTVSGSPNRTGLELARIREVRRMRDGWTWRSAGGGHVSVVTSH